jgi:restriction system protein
MRKISQYARLQRPRTDYICFGCGASIVAGTAYIRDEPHPQARRHRGEVVRHWCTVCALGKPLSEVVMPKPVKAARLGIEGQLILPLDEAIQGLPPAFLQMALLDLGGATDDGRVVRAVALPWFEALGEILRSGDSLFQLPWRRVEELVAGAYQEDGWEVVLTPRSGDRGRDLIATKRGFLQVRLVDQIKALTPGRLVDANDVRALVGVLASDLNTTKGVVTTTTDFAPGISEDPLISRHIPFRLELRNGVELRSWLAQLARLRS